MTPARQAEWLTRTGLQLLVPRDTATLAGLSKPGRFFECRRPLTLAVLRQSAFMADAAVRRFYATPAFANFCKKPRRDAGTQQICDVHHISTSFSAIMSSESIFLWQR
ncbi:hypothetical protein HHL21_08830 [Massilia sp. RP-1-19]|uniref:Uncharacterized protein n=1 Tax=Massilia polaris TaxID=2728846 RepID=A0A848HJB8_9BURK|nr:hypothetical protein [Massilia polaris]NML61182.1 hypothetical protein [Massilia polaris]